MVLVLLDTICGGELLKECLLQQTVDGSFCPKSKSKVYARKPGSPIDPYRKAVLDAVEKLEKHWKLT